MKEVDYAGFEGKLDALKTRLPLYGLIELTYRCSYNCVHCYCNNQPKDELGLSFWKDILEQIHSLGGIKVVFSGGEPLLYQGFEEVYRYAKEKGFLVTLLTSGYVLDKERLDFLEGLPPLDIEITINSLNREDYEKITRTKNTFDKLMSNIYEIKRRGLPLVIKCNGLKENKDEILKIKRFTEELLGKKKFKFDPFIFPGLNRNQEPKRHRLRPEEIIEIEKQDRDMLEQEEQLRHQVRLFNPGGLYHCDAWISKYIINPQGILQFCHLTKKYSTDLKREPFRKGFDKFLDILKERNETDSGCIKCEYREYCYHCPARAYLECGDEEAPVEYYCQLAQAFKSFRDSLD